MLMVFPENVSLATCVSIHVPVNSIDISSQIKSPSTAFRIIVSAPDPAFNRFHRSLEDIRASGKNVIASV